MICYKLHYWLINLKYKVYIVEKKKIEVFIVIVYIYSNWNLSRSRGKDCFLYHAIMLASKIVLVGYKLITLINIALKFYYYLKPSSMLGIFYTIKRSILLFLTINFLKSF